MDNKISSSKASSGFKNAVNNNSFKFNDEEIESIQEIQSDNSNRRNSVSPNSKGNTLAQKVLNDQSKLASGVIIRNRRDEDDQVSKQKQIKFENAQINLEILKFKIEKNLFIRSESYIKYMTKYISSVKEKIIDSYFVAAIPSIIDSFIFEEDLRSRNVSLISESLMKVIKRIPKTPRIEEEEPNSKPKNQSNNEGKEDQKTLYDEEEDTILDEKRLQILTVVTFRDLFQRKVKILEMRKRELFYKSLVYLDYDTVKIISIKNKGLWIGCIYEIQKVLTMLESSKSGDDQSTPKLTPAYVSNRAMGIYQKIIKLGMNKSSFTDYKDYTQKIREFLAIKWFYQGWK